MSTAPAAPPPNTNPNRPLVPPEEKFWIRYSPHNEAPLSGVSSFAVHVLAIPLLLLIAWVASRVTDEDEKRSLPVDVVRVNFSGGGGSKVGVGDGPGSLDQPQKESGPSSEEKPPDRTPPPDDPPKAPSVAQKQDLKSELKDDKHAEKLLTNATRASERLFNLDRDVRDALVSGLRAAWVETAPRRRVQRGRWVTAQHDPLAPVGRSGSAGGSAESSARV